ncbi:DUF7948 domain-containing protein [Parvicella tangerina]|uniref:PKD domain-containing protein n=1 Tax=Parvicella tangerina TaxID=2829795 RepID=A0A916JQ78_9FLAO|nr:PKD domain-containing protein [Parvicella tangerina]CAG5087235.1 hypothetical protein CRYO30217_03425 [Parvicella tangerina]
MNKLYILKAAAFLFILLFAAPFFAHNDIQRGFHFTENKGQFDERVEYQCRLHLGNLFLEKNRFTFDLFDPVGLSEMHEPKAKDVKDINPFFTKTENSTSKYEASEGLSKHAYSMTFLGASANPETKGNERLSGYKNYYFGNDKTKWTSEVSSYRGVSYENMYPGINVEIYSQLKYLKYDIIVSPNTDPDQIKISYDGIEGLKVLENGDLEVQLSKQRVREAKLSAYQVIDGSQKTVPCEFKIIDGNIVTFNFPNGFDENYELIIDPVWVFSTLTGSTADNWGYTSTYDSQGNLYAAGIAFSTGYPTTTGAYQTSFAGGDIDISVSKFSANGSNLLFSTYLGGSSVELPHSLVVDSQDNLVMLTSTSSSNFPVTAGCYDNTFNLGFNNTTTSTNITFTNGSDIALVKFNSNGTSLLGSTFVGGTDNEGLNESFDLNYADDVRGEVVLDANDDIYVATSVFSDDFPTTTGSSINNGSGYGSQDAAVFKMSSDLSSLLWGSYYGGTGNDASYSIRVSPVNGDVFICGGSLSSDLPMGGSSLNGGYIGSGDGFIASFDGSNGSFLNSTYLGTTSYDQSFIIEIDDDGDVYALGQTKGSYPVFNAPYSNANGSQFIQKISPDLSTSIFSTVFGSGRSTVDISPTAFLVDDCENIYVAGWGGATNSEGHVGGMPLTSDAQQSTTDQSDFYFMVMERDASSLLYGTYFGDPSSDEHVDGGTSRFDKKGVVYQAVCAGCGGGSFPTTPGVYSSTNGSSNCNLGAIKFEMNFQGVQANASIPEDITLCTSPYSVDFDAPTTDAPPSAEWIYGDGNTSGIIGGSVSPTHVYADTGSYQITYIAIDPASCNVRDTAYFDVTLIQPEQFSASISVPPIDPCTAPDSLLVSLEFTGSGADSIIWNMGNGDVFYDSLTLDYYYTSQGTYTIDMIAIDSVCDNRDTISETFDYLFTGVNANATAPPDTAFCGPPPYDLDFSATSPSPYHFWDFGDGSGTSTQPSPSYTYTTPGTYDIMYVAIDSSTCNIADTVYFNVDISQAEELSANFNLPTVEPCTSPDSILVELDFTGTGADSLSWDMGDGSTFEDSTSIDYYYTSEGQYIITMQAWDFYCNVTDVFVDTVDFFTSYSQANAEDPGDIFLCTSPLNVDFSAGTNPTPDVFWDFGDGSGTSTDLNPTYTYADTGSYEVMFVAIDSSTCNIADTIYFDVSLAQAETFAAELNFTPPPPCGSSTALVEAQFTGSGADSIVWDMGNGDLFYTDSIYYIYTDPGTYVVSMTAYDQVCNREGTVSDTVKFVGEVISEALVPNVFTPNGDGDNDLLKIPGIDPTANFYMIIYNRWGRKVFESENNGTFWDGTVNGGADAADGVYFFEVRYKDVCTDEEKIETGHVNLIR